MSPICSLHFLQIAQGPERDPSPKQPGLQKQHPVVLAPGPCREPSLSAGRVSTWEGNYSDHSRHAKLLWLPITLLELNLNLLLSFRAKDRNYEPVNVVRLPSPHPPP